jgi:hypothetical protein
MLVANTSDPPSRRHSTCNSRTQNYGIHLATGMLVANTSDPPTRLHSTCNNAVITRRNVSTLRTFPFYEKECLFTTQDVSSHVSQTGYGINQETPVSRTETNNKSSASHSSPSNQQFYHFNLFRKHPLVSMLPDLELGNMDLLKKTRYWCKYWTLQWQALSFLPKSWQEITFLCLPRHQREGYSSHKTPSKCGQAVIANLILLLFLI